MAAPDTKKYPVPESLVPYVGDNQVALLHFPKMSYGRAPSQPVWIVRDPDNPWCFHDAWGYKPSEQEKKADSELREAERRASILTQVQAHLQEECDAGRYPTKTSVRENLIVLIDGKKVGKQRLSDMIEVGVVHNAILACDLPKELQRGGRAHFLAPGPAVPTAAELRFALGG